MKISHTTFRVSDMEKSLEFYRDVLGFAIDGEINAGPRRIVFLGDTEGALELISGDGVPENPGQGVSVGVFYAKDALELAMSKIKERNISLEGPVSPNPNLTFFFVKDPDGYTVQLCLRV